MKTTLSMCMALTLLISSVVVGQDPTLFPNRLDPEGLSRSSNLVPPPILSDSDTRPAFRVAKQEPQTWESVLTDSHLNDDDTTSTYQGPGSGSPPIVVQPWNSRNTTAQLVGQEFSSNNVESHAVPLIRIETITPAEVSTYIESAVTIKVSNQGPTLAEAVGLTVELSDNVDVVATQPASVAQEKGSWYFKLGQLENGEETQVQFTIKANRPGQITVKPRVSLAATSQASIKAVQPSVQVRMIGNDEIIVGGGISREIVITNDGHEAIRNLQINSVVSNNLISDIKFSGENQTIEWLAPGESRRFTFDAAAVAAGTSNITFAIRGDNIRTEFKNAMKIARRTIQTQVSGPELTYKNSTGTYSIDIVNEAPTDADNIHIVLDLPRGMDIQVVDREARYNPSKTKLTWSIPRLRAGQTESIPFKAAIKSTGSHKLKVSAVSNKRVLSKSHLNTHVVGRANINLQVLSLADAVETGSASKVHIKVANNGSDSASNVRIVVQLPDSVQAIPAKEFEIDGDRLIIAPFNLPAGRSRQIEFQVVGATNGEVTVRATAASDSTTNDISAEKNLFFFNGSKN